MPPTLTTDHLERATTRRQAFLAGTTVDAFGPADLTAAVDQLDDLLHLARTINVATWPLDAAIPLIAEAAAAAIVGQPSSRLTRKYGLNTDNTAAIDRYRAVRADIEATLADIRRTIGDPSTEGRITWFAWNGASR